MGVVVNTINPKIKKKYRSLAWYFDRPDETAWTISSQSGNSPCRDQYAQPKMRSPMKRRFAVKPCTFNSNTLRYSQINKGQGSHLNSAEKIEEEDNCLSVSPDRRAKYTTDHSPRKVYNAGKIDDKSRD